jgi:hypothetical protein
LWRLDAELTGNLQRIVPNRGGQTDSGEDRLLFCSVTAFPPE